MKTCPIKNLFEYRDTKNKRALKNLQASVGKFEGLGLPDLCYITKKIPKGIFRSGFEEESSFHFVQGLCPSSEQIAQQYMLSIIEGQTQFYKNFSNYQIDNIVYATYDIFSKTLILCQMDQFTKAGHQFQLQAVNENLQFIEISELYWQGAYISGILRTINTNLDMPIACKFLNVTKLNNSENITLIIQKLFTLTQGNSNYYDLIKVCSKSDFPTLDNLIYYLNWPLFILYRHFSKTQQLDILIKQLKSLEENTTVIYIKGIIFYKTKNYRQSLEELLKLANNVRQYNVTKYLLAKVYIKLKIFDNAFALLKNILQDTLENQIVWTTLAQLFRKKQLPEISFILLNKAASFSPEKNISSFEKLLNLQNFQIFCECKQIKNPKSLSKIYNIINPHCAQQIECFVQLSGHPNLDQLWMKNCASNKDKVVEQVKRHLQNPKCRIKATSQQLLINNELANKEQNEFQKETLKLTNSLDNFQIKKFLNELFYQEAQVKQEQLTLPKDPSDEDFKLIFTEKYESRFPSQISSIDISQNEPLTHLLQKTRNEYNSPEKFKKRIAKNKSEKISSDLFKIVILEKSLESFESEIENEKDEQKVEYVNVSKPKNQQNYCTSVPGLHTYLNDNLIETQRQQLTRQMQNRKEKLNHLFFYTIDNILKVQQELETLFLPTRLESKYSAITETQQIESPAISDIMKTNLHQQSRIHLITKNQIQDIYFFESEKFSSNLQNNIRIATKTEAGFLYKCSMIAIKLKKFELAIDILQKMCSKMISVQVYSQLFELMADQHDELLELFQKILQSFIECGIENPTLPLWIEKPFIKLLATLGPQNVQQKLQSPHLTLLMKCVSHYI